MTTFLQQIKNIRANEFFLWLGYVALLLMAFLAMITDKFGDRAGKAMVVIGCILLLKRGRALLTSPPVLLALLAVALQLLTWAAMQWQYPEWAESSPKVERLAAWFAFVPVAVLLAGERWKIILMLMLAAASLFISPWVTGDGWNEIIRGLEGQRIDFGVRNAQHTAMLFGVMLIAFSGLLLESLFQPSIDWKKVTLYSLLVFLSSVVVVITQTRAVWLALSVVICCLILFGLIYSFKHQMLSKRLMFTVLGFVIILGGVVTSQVGERLQTRINHELTNIKLALSGSDQYQSNTSTGIRLDTWYESLEWIANRPVLGWGGNGRDLVVKHTDRLTEENKMIFRHLHNSYLDTLVNYGMLGLACMLLLFGYLVFIAWTLYQSGVLTLGVLLSAGSLLVYTLVVNCFESYMYYSSGKYVLTMLGGGLLSLYWKSKNAIP